MIWLIGLWFENILVSIKIKKQKKHSYWLNKSKSNLALSLFRVQKTINYKKSLQNRSIRKKRYNKPKLMMHFV